MKPDDTTALGRLAEWIDHPAESLDTPRLQQFQHWLLDEALPAGGIGPDEAPRIWRRHILDSLSFLKAIPNSIEAVVDVGSGVGLPGIPLAIAHPDWNVTLVDRSERRTWLARRAVRILGIENCTAVQADSATWAPDVGMRGDSVQSTDVVVSRASMPLPQLIRHARRIAPGASLVAGWSHESPPPPDAPVDATIEVPATVLGEPAWLVQIGL